METAFLGCERARLAIPLVGFRHCFRQQFQRMRRVRRRPLPRPARNRKPTFTCKSVAKTRLRPTSLCQQAARCAQYSAPTTQCREQKWSFAPDGKCSRRKPDKEAWRNGGGPSIVLPHPALPAPAQKASSPSVARTCVRSRDHGRTCACACTRTRTKRRPHLRLQPHPYPRRGHGRKKKAPVVRRTIARTCVKSQPAER